MQAPVAVKAQQWDKANKVRPCCGTALQLVIETEKHVFDVRKQVGLLVGACTR